MVRAPDHETQGAPFPTRQYRVVRLYPGYALHLRSPAAHRIRKELRTTAFCCLTAREMVDPPYGG
jgi:hypothetical protein